MRHSWGEPSRPSELRTERVCKKCGLLRVTRHDGGSSAIPWTEFYRKHWTEHKRFGEIELQLIEGTRTPECEGIMSA